MSVGNNLKTLRANKNISQQEVADYLSITRQAYSFYENDKRQPDYETLLKLAEYFNVSVGRLFGESEEEDEILDIISRNAKKLSHEDRKRLLDVARIMFKEAFDDTKT